MYLTFTDCSTIRILDITAFGACTGSPSAALSATSSTLMIAARVLDSVERLEPSAAPRGMGECERMYCLTRFIVGTTRGKVRNTIEAMKATFPIRRDFPEAKAVLG